MTQTAHPFRTALEARDLDGAVALLSDDVKFRSPVAFEPYHGRDAVKGILAAVFDEWRCIREIGAPDGRDHALVFQARIGDRLIEGCDFLHLGNGIARMLLIRHQGRVATERLLRRMAIPAAM